MNTKRLLIAALILLAAFSLTVLEPSDPTTGVSQPRLPWSIELNGNQNPQVFGITLTETRVNELISELGEEFELGIIIDQQDQPRLEVYYASFLAGPIQGKLIATITADKPLLQQLATQAHESEYLKSGSRKFLLNIREVDVSSLPVSQLTFIPKVSFDEAIITQRFGKASNILTLNEEIRYFLFPDKQLIIEHNLKGKEALYYLDADGFTDRLAMIEQQISKPTPAEPADQ